MRIIYGCFERLELVSLRSFFFGAEVSVWASLVCERLGDAGSASCAGFERNLEEAVGRVGIINCVVLLGRGKLLKRLKLGNRVLVYFRWIKEERVLLCLGNGGIWC